MTIRPATEEDIPAIVALLRLGLGEQRTPKSESLWRWKHETNPFGRSAVLLAFEGDVLTGVRAFMRWQWSDEGRTYQSVRAVDTVTHPDYTGMGIFRKLTLSMVEQMLAENVDFIFNTPNPRSGKGYLTMGWERRGRLAMHVRPVFSTGRKEEAPSVERPPWNDLWLPSAGNGMRTSWSARYFQWRYLENPIARYEFLGPEGKEDPFLLVCRVKPHRYFRELRVCDAFVPDRSQGDRVRQRLLAAAAIHQCRVVTWTELPVAMWNTRLPAGPDLFVNRLRLRDDAVYNAWRPSLGDIEIF